MKHYLQTIVAGVVLWATPLASEPLPPAAFAADIVILGEVHDNPGHHARQAEWVAALSPTAIVFEMLEAPVDQAAIAKHRDDAGALGQALGWEARGWPDFAMYHRIFTAAPKAKIVGAAVPRETARRLMQSPLDEAFGPDAATYGLDADLPDAEQAAREALQARAHCDALPVEMLPVMVSIQRLRDANLARAAVTAYDETGGPVVIITGNGHARADWGVPALIDGLSVFTLGQSEDGNPPQGTFDLVRDSPGMERPDPCAAFR